MAVLESDAWGKLEGLDSSNNFGAVINIPDKFGDVDVALLRTGVVAPQPHAICIEPEVLVARARSSADLTGAVACSTGRSNVLSASVG